MYVTAEELAMMKLAKEKGKAPAEYAGQYKNKKVQ